MASSFAMGKTPVNAISDSIDSYRGRFAPSPTGFLHFGSLVAALASFLDARHFGGEWLVRIEDLDPPRAVPGSIDCILHDLETLGMQWDGSIVYQSERAEIYQAYLDQLAPRNQVYYCSCTRKEIADSAIIGIDGPVYPGTCKEANQVGSSRCSVRVITADGKICFTDRCRGEIQVDLEKEIGDFNVRRSDGLWAYQFATAIDDAIQEITQVVRGADLLYSTPRQIFLQQLLGLPSPSYMHIPIVLERNGSKLSKSENSEPVSGMAARKLLCSALGFLAHAPPAEFQLAPTPDIMEWAIDAWQPERVAEIENHYEDA